MNGPEHYAEAERLAELAMSPAGLALMQDGYDIAGAAQVHATLALTAAVANTERDGASLPLADRPTAWDGARGDRATWQSVTA